MTNESEIDANLAFRVAELQESYAQHIDEDDIESWPDFFIEKGNYRIIPRENHDHSFPIAVVSCDNRNMMADRVFSLRTANIYAKHFYRHILGRPRWLGEDADGANRFQTNYVLFRTVEQRETMIYSTGRYLDRIVEIDGELKFAEKIVVYDNTRIDTLLVTPI